TCHRRSDTLPGERSSRSPRTGRTIMGLFDFVKEAGAKVFGKDEPQVAPQKRDMDPAKLEIMKRNKALQNLVAELGLQVENLNIAVTGSTAVVTGLVDDQAEREKVVLAVGNVVGIARVDDRLEAKKKSPEAQMHTVVSGDTLSKIAKRFDVTLDALLAANKDTIDDPDKIKVGDEIIIPVPEPPEEVAEPSAEPSEES
ncbi:MAG TPA: LysM peptidoglycan-binding domain-containing protein, partial [Candidatus Limnocylindrales bacterium]